MKRFKTIEVREYEKMLKEISCTNLLDNDNYDLLIYGGGGQDRKFYNKLKNNPKCEVLWTGWSGPKWSKFLSFIPGQAGLLKILQQDYFYEIYYELAAYSVSDVIYIRKELTKELCEQVITNTWKMNFNAFTEGELYSFVLTSEADQIIKENGQEKFFYNYKFGSGLNQSLKKIITREK
ncbi:MAG: hypothetical protein ACWA5P_10865 [bacterium]